MLVAPYVPNVRPPSHPSLPLPFSTANSSNSNHQPPYLYSTCQAHTISSRPRCYQRLEASCRILPSSPCTRHLLPTIACLSQCRKTCTFVSECHACLLSTVGVAKATHTPCHITHHTPSRHLRLTSEMLISQTRKTARSLSMVLFTQSSRTPVLHCRKGFCMSAGKQNAPTERACRKRSTFRFHE